MGIGDIADDLLRGLGGLGSGLTEAFSDPVIRLGVTGLSRAGKTVFITSLVANLMDRGRMPGLRAAAEGRILSAFLQPQPDDTVPRFDYEVHLDELTGPAPRWPESTRAVSELRLSFRLAEAGLFGGMRGPRTLHLDIVDYPGEWLLDLALMEQDYAGWSAEVLTRIEPRVEAAGYLAQIAGLDAAAAHDEMRAKALAEGFASYLGAARAAGYSDCTPGRFLLPGELAGSPVLTFAPLPKPAEIPRGALWREMERRFEAYKAKVVKPFFRDHFAKIDRQVVLVDALGAIHAGPRAVEDMRRAMAGILAAFRPGRTGWLTGLLGLRRVERILFAATKADHLHHLEHAKLTRIMAALMRDAKDRAEFAGAETAAMAIASLRATVEESVRHEGRMLDCVRGRLLDGGREAAFYPGDLPDNPAALLAPAREGATQWLDADYEVMAFAPAVLKLKPGEGPPHIRLDRAAEFLIGDRL
ncbi:YcjX family protein [Defluviimonas sp. WL0024]|uniref:YcjX family protein n=1 Tax=Albidovulum salinarum TaxID=2984153 RepID=A0ABT2X8Z7_9RHOB|nr:YcjX family protein [Defluviimonas sp. WL0024]MCU9849834.1 YcjX family protein [Defluviimonas sp. WL0024]